MEQPGFGGARQLIRERARLLRGQVEPEDLDGNETVALRLVGAEDGPERTDTDLMQDPEWAELWGRGEG
jgi:hypothetical protein